MIALVKIDVAAVDLNRSARQVFDLVIGGTLLEPGLTWVFNLANDPADSRRDLRFWRPELQQRRTGSGPQVGADDVSLLPLEEVLARILPVTRTNFAAGEVDQMFQIRPRTRIDFGMELAGQMRGTGRFYSRAALAEFLRRRHIGHGVTGTLKKS